jgi:hypothetical protein
MRLSWAPERRLTTYCVEELAVATVVGAARLRQKLYSHVIQRRRTTLGGKRASTQGNIAFRWYRHQPFRHSSQILGSCGQ